jgi:hypothetical protein
MDHVWRVFENGNEFIVKHVRINVPVHDEITGNGTSTGGDDYNFCCEGYMTVDKASSTVTINANKD